MVLKTFVKIVPELCSMPVDLFTGYCTINVLAEQYLQTAYSPGGTLQTSSIVSTQLLSFGCSPILIFSCIIQHANNHRYQPCIDSMVQYCLNCLVRRHGWQRSCLAFLRSYTQEACLACSCPAASFTCTVSFI